MVCFFLLASCKTLAITKTLAGEAAAAARAGACLVGRTAAQKTLSTRCADSALCFSAARATLDQSRD